MTIQQENTIVYNELVEKAIQKEINENEIDLATDQILEILNQKNS